MPRFRCIATELQRNVAQVSRLADKPAIHAASQETCATFNNWTLKKGKQRMKLKSLFTLLLATACAFAAFAEEAFDVKKTEAMFAGTEWAFWRTGGNSETVVTFTRNKQVVVTGKSDWATSVFSGEWVASGLRAVTINGETLCEISPDKKRIYVTSQEKKDMVVLFRGVKLPSEDTEAVNILCKSGTVWAAQIEGRRATIALDADFGCVVISNVKNGQVEQCRRWGGVGGYYLEMFVGDDGFERSKQIEILLLVPDDKGGWSLKNYYYEFFPEPAQPGDPLPPKKVSRDKASLKGTAWCTFDAKTAKMRTLSFAANGVTSDSAFQGQRGEWNQFDNDMVHYKVGEHSRSLTIDLNKKRLMRENNDVREVWFQGGQPPRLSVIENKQLKEKIADKSKAWLNWNDGKKTAYVFDDKAGNVSITKEDGKPKVVKWDILCAGCIRIGNEVFMLEGETLERVEPRLTLKQETSF